MHNHRALVASIGIAALTCSFLSTPPQAAEKPNLIYIMAVERGQYAHSLIADEAIAFIEKNKKRPFFLYFSPTIPHANNEAGRKGMEIPSWGQYADLDWPEPQKGHAAMISLLDADVGRLLAKLKELGIDHRELLDNPN